MRQMNAKRLSFPIPPRLSGSLAGRAGAGCVPV